MSPICALALALLLPAGLASREKAPAASAAETRVVEYLRTNVRHGQPLVVSDLANRVFTTPEERAVLDRLFNSFFKLPLFVARRQRESGRPPTLAEISEQFRFHVPGQADVMLRILEGDPRLPRFLERDTASGEITRVDVEAILAHPQFGKALERSLSGWEGRNAPAWAASGAGGTAIGSDTLAGRPYLAYFWFSGCPPCMRTSPLLPELQKRVGPLAIVAVNADAVLEVPVSTADRAAYAQRHGWAFALAEASPATLAAFGAIDVFPTFFFVDRKGVVVRQLVNFQELAVLEAAALRALD